MDSFHRLFLCLSRFVYTIHLWYNHFTALILSPQRKEKSPQRHVTLPFLTCVPHSVKSVILKEVTP